MTLHKISIKDLMIFIAWIAVAMSGMCILYSYQNQIGQSGDPIMHWPNSSKIKFIEGKKKLLMFLHPKCPCSRASLNELNKILSRHKKLNYDIIFTLADQNLDWLKNSDLYKIIKSNNLNYIIDHQAKESKLFNAKTSGLVTIFNENKELIFRGGITESRGHEGDNKGLRAAQKALETNKPGSNDFYVFGCALSSRLDLNVF